MTSRATRLGLFGGTFDPIHHGHLLQARAALERFELDRVVLIPCAQSPHKDRGPRATGLHRLAMARLAVRGEPGFVVSDLEARRPPPSFSVETAEHFAKRFHGAELFWLLGADQRPKLREWHRYEDFRRIVELLYLGRGGERSRIPPDIPDRIDLSSTAIRDRVRAGLSIRYCVPDPVARYIQRHRLYLE
jgi:nicotinate-nucleotide adenylyltransferase